MAAFVLALILLFSTLISDIALATENDSAVDNTAMYSVNLNQCDNGSIYFESLENETEESIKKITSAEFEEGNEISIIVSPDEGYEASTYQITDAETEETIISGAIEDNAILFDMPAHNAVVDVVFSEIESVEETQDEKSSISVENSDTSDENAESDSSSEPNTDEDDSGKDVSNQDVDTENDIDDTNNSEDEDSQEKSIVSRSATVMRAAARAAINAITSKTGNFGDGIPYAYGKGYFNALAGTNYTNFAAGSGLTALTAKKPQSNNVYFTGTDNTPSARTAAVYQFSNTSFNNNIYVDCYNCGEINGQAVDARIYLKLGTSADGCSYESGEKATVVVYKNGLIEFGVNTIYGLTSSGEKDSSNVIFKPSVPATICYRIQFYKAGTLSSGTSSPVYGKGYCLIKDIDGAVYNADTPHKWEGLQIPSAGNDGIYLNSSTYLGIDTSTNRTQLTDTWWWNVKDLRTLDDDMEAWLGILYNASSSSKPFEFQYHAGTIYWMVINNGTYDVRYHIVQSGNYVWPKQNGVNVPASTITPTTKTLAQYCDISTKSTGGANELFISTSNANQTLADKLGYKWVPWQTSSTLTGSTFANSASLLKKDIDVYGGFQLKTGTVKVTKNISAPSYYTGGKSGFQFRLSGTALNGTSVSLTATTNSSGVATFSSVPMGTYTVTEINADSKWTLGSSPTVTLTNDGETKNVTYTNTYKTGSVNIVKTITDSTNSQNSLAGFVFKVTGTADGYTFSKTVTTDANGNASVTQLPAGTYTVTEIGVPGSSSAIPSYWKSDKTNNATTVTIAWGGTGTVKFNNTFLPAKLNIKKTSTTNSSTIVAGAKYALYTDSACTTIAKDVGGNDVTFTTTASGSNTVNILPGTYYLKETTSPDHYTYNPSVYTVTTTANNTTTVSTADAPKSYLKMVVSSANPSITDGNSCYSLKDAVYYLYSDPECSKQVGTFTTLEDGTTNTIEVDAGTYYIKQQVASDGYEVCNSSMTKDGASASNVHSVTVPAGQTKTVNCLEPPLSNLLGAEIQKIDADTGKPLPQGTASLEGGIFELDYYANKEGNVSDTPYKKWYFQTDSNGCIDTKNVDYLVENLTLSTGTVLKSDELYKNLSGEITDPLGTYVIKEIVPPKYYQLDGTIRFANSAITSTADVKTGLKFLIAEDENGKAQIYKDGAISSGVLSAENMSLNVVEKIYKGSVNLTKYAMNGSSPLPGVTYKLVGDDGTTYTAKTDSEGKIVFDNLIPQHYVLTETSTIDGYDLMKDNVNIDLPLEMTEADIAKYGADKSKAVWDEQTQSYCFYDLSYDITNTPKFDMPTTGGGNKMLYAELIAAITLVCGCMIYIFRKRKSE